jgi:oligosaccharyltransferase complex subunit beta
LYDHVFLLDPALQELGGGPLGFGSLLDFVNQGGNVLVATDSSTSETLRDFALEFSVDFDDQGTSVLDYFHSLDEPSLLVLSSGTFPSKAPFSTNKNPILFQGLGHRLSGKNQLSFPLLSAHPSSFSYSLKDLQDDPSLRGNPILGSDLSLVSLFQARNNARLVFTGSTLMFSNG